MNKRIIIDLEIGEGESAERTANTLFAAATDAVSNPVSFIGLAKYKIMHQRIEDIRQAKK